MQATSEVTTRSEQRAFDGVQGFYAHESRECKGPMRFGVYLPPAARQHPVPAVYFLAGLSCTEETFAQKAGAQRVAAALGLALVTPDTSPRAARFAGDDEDWDFGQGAGFYVDATETPWAGAYRMHSYVAHELPAFVEQHFPIVAHDDARAIFGHSMGGHGALTIALGHPGRYRSVSALAPIVAPSEVPWGQKSLTRYLGADRQTWARYDASRLVREQTFAGTILIDQGTSDKFLERQLRPELWQAAAAAAGQPTEVHLRDGYDHSYFFVASFVEAHLRHHATALGL
jgi:S-formylglutathione hydrolase